MRNQATVGTVLCNLLGLLVVGGIGVATTFLMLNMDKGDSSQSLLIFGLLVGYIGGAIFLGLFIFSLFRYKITNRVKKYGKRSTCTIADFKTHRGRGIKYHYIVLFYNGEDGNRYENKIFWGLTTPYFQKGCHIECKILGKNCYVDKNHIIIVHENK